MFIVTEYAALKAIIYFNKNILQLDVNINLLTL